MRFFVLLFYGGAIMAQFRYFAIPSNAKVKLSARIHGDQIPKDDAGEFVIKMQAPQDVITPAADRPKKTGEVMFGGKQNVDERAAKFQLHKLLEAGFLPNNIFLIADTKAKESGWYYLNVWLDTDEKSSRKSFAERGEYALFAFEVVTAKWSCVMAYDNGDMWSFNMIGRTLDDRQSNYFGLVPKVIPARVASSVKKALPTPALLVNAPPSAMELAFSKLTVT